MLLLAAAVYIATTVHGVASTGTVTGCSEDGVASHKVGTVMPQSFSHPRLEGKGNIFADKLAVRLLEQNFGKQRFVFASPWLEGHRETIASELSAALASATVDYYSAKGIRVEDLGLSLPTFAAPTALDALEAYLSSHGDHLDDDYPLPSSAVLRQIVQHDGGSEISAISAEIARLFAREVNVNAYISAPHASALAPHTDT